MKKILLFLVLNSPFLILNSYAQSPNWLWATSAGGTGYDVANCVTSDASGNSIATGDFWSPALTFGSTTLTNASVINQSDLFIVKKDIAGNVIWAKSAGGADEDRGLSVTTDASGNIIVVGYFASATITFDTITLTKVGGIGDMYIVKYDTAGNVLWAHSAGGTAYEGSNSVTTDTSGNIITSGAFTSPSLTFGFITLTNTSGSNDIYTVKYDAAGNVLWAKSATGSAWDYGTATVDIAGNVIVSGTYLSSTLTFGTTTLVNTGGGSWDYFIVKYNSAGILLWAKSAGGTSSDGASDITADASGNIIAAGSFGSTNITFGTITLTNTGFGAMFIVKYDAAGNALWAYSYGGAVASSVCTDVSGKIILAGYFNTPSLTIGSVTFTNADNSGNTSDLFIVKYDTTGNILWAKSAGGINSDQANSITADASGNIFTAGLFYSPAITFGSTTLTNASSFGNTYDIFIAKLDSATITGNNEIENLAKGVLLFPNPANNFFTIALGSTNEEVEITITDITGKIIYSVSEIEKQSIKVNTKDFAEGIYLVKIQSEDFLKTEKLIVTK